MGRFFGVIQSTGSLTDSWYISLSYRLDIHRIPCLGHVVNLVVQVPLKDDIDADAPEDDILFDNDKANDAVTLSAAGETVEEDVTKSNAVGKPRKGIVKIRCGRLCQYMYIAEYLICL